MASRLRSRNRFGGLTQYQSLRNAAITAARANNASLWFAGAPSDLAGFVWQDSAGTVPATGTDPIGRITDRAGSNAATQSTAANKPTLELQANGYYGMRFDGVNDTLLDTSPQATSSVTLIVGGRFTTSGLGVFFGQGATKGVQFYFSLSGQISANQQDGTAVVNTATGVYTLNSNAVLSLSGTVGSAFSLYQNGALIAVNTPAGLPNFSGSGASYLMTQQGGSLPVNGVAGLMFYSRTQLSTADRIAIERFAALLSGANYP